MTDSNKGSSTRDAAWFDLQYDNRRRVPEFAQHLARWRESSALARAELACHLDIPFTQAGAVSLDVFPAAKTNAPVLVFIHGGYWRSLDKSDFSFVAAPFVAAGAMVVVPNYSLCPAVTVDAIALQCAHAMAWVHRQAARFGGDAAHCVVAGHSAGGHLAAMLLACDGTRVARDLPRRLVRSAVSISGLYEMAPLAAAPSLQVDLRLTPDVIARCSPAAFAAPIGARLASVVGALESEEFLRQNRLIRERWGDAVVPVCEELPGRNHFTVLDELVQAQSALQRRTLEWLAD
ncbi:MAG TPA: alpha/beta hydrolase [Acidiferrobacterales bacterium]|nr:alpha/beta hydrolase [Acidiferrobacterales bacterium]